MMRNDGWMFNTFFYGFPFSSFGLDSLSISSWLNDFCCVVMRKEDALNCFCVPFFFVGIQSYVRAMDVIDTMHAMG
jgi:hypothetical protein